MAAKVKQIFIVMVSFLFFSAIASAATVSADSFTKSCNTCSFDSSGKMDKKCWEDIQDGAKTNLALAYPSMSFKYQFGGGCAALDQCIAALQSCKALRTSGNDRSDCYQGDVMVCFKMADSCAEAANKVCTEDKSEEESGLKDTLKNMTTKPGEKKDEEDDGGIVVVDAEDNPFAWLCMEPAFILAFAFAGAFFYRRR